MVTKHNSSMVLKLHGMEHMKPTLTPTTFTAEKKISKITSGKFAENMIKIVSQKQDFDKKVQELLKEHASKKPAGIFF
jgi:hypothetical protein